MRFVQYVQLVKRSGGDAAATPAPSKPTAPGPPPTFTYNFGEDRRVAREIEAKLETYLTEDSQLRQPSS